MYYAIGVSVPSLHRLFRLHRSFLRWNSSLFSPLCTWWMLLWRLLLVFTFTKVAFGGTAANLSSLFRGRKFLKLLKGLMVGQAVPEIPLSVGSKLELLRAFAFGKFPYTSPYTHAFVRVYMYMYIAVYIYTFICYIQ